MSCLRFAVTVMFATLFFGSYIFSSPADTPMTILGPRKQILFICTGNYYRSRFAEALFNKLAQDRHLRWQGISRGLSLDATQHGISPYTQQELIKRSVPSELSRGEPRPLVKGDLDASDYVVLMDEAEHRPMFEKRFTARQDKVHYWHIPETDESDIPKACENMTWNVQTLLRRLDQ